MIDTQDQSHWKISKIKKKFLFVAIALRTTASTDLDGNDQKQ